mmetsp:Transcript_128527/g.399997  ORF Transcript_128527/g.399997 Transcript_128527/m.399997 type:complete len:456 (-) Transcript_128527:486-1853(-)
MPRRWRTAPPLSGHGNGLLRRIPASGRRTGPRLPRRQCIGQLGQPLHRSARSSVDRGVQVQVCRHSGLHRDRAPQQRAVRGVDAGKRHRGHHTGRGVHMHALRALHGKDIHPSRRGCWPSVPRLGRFRQPRQLLHRLLRGDRGAVQGPLQGCRRVHGHRVPRQRPLRGVDAPRWDRCHRPRVRVHVPSIRGCHYRPNAGAGPEPGPNASHHRHNYASGNAGARPSAGAGPDPGSDAARHLGRREHEDDALLGLQRPRLRRLDPAALGREQVHLAAGLRPAGPRRLWWRLLRRDNVADGRGVRRPLGPDGTGRRLLRGRRQRRRRRGLRQVRPGAEPGLPAPRVDGGRAQKEPLPALVERLRRRGAALRHRRARLRQPPVVDSQRVRPATWHRLPEPGAERGGGELVAAVLQHGGLRSPLRPAPGGLPEGLQALRLVGLAARRPGPREVPRRRLPS